MNRIDAYDRVRSLSRFYRSLTWFAIVAILFFIHDCFDKGSFNLSNFDFSGILLIWSIFLAVKAFKLFVFSPDWEREMIEKELKKDEFYYKTK